MSSGVSACGSRPWRCLQGILSWPRLALAATHRVPPDGTAHRRSNGPSHHRQLCCPPGSTGTTAASGAHPADSPLPGSVGYRTLRSDGTTRRPPGRAGLRGSPGALLHRGPFRTVHATRRGTRP